MDIAERALRSLQMVYGFTSKTGVPMVAILFLDSQELGGDNEEESLFVSFFDGRYRFTRFGQIISTYYWDTLNDHDGGLDLAGGVPAWTVDLENMQGVQNAIRDHIRGTKMPEVA